MRPKPKKGRPRRSSQSYYSRSSQSYSQRLPLSPGRASIEARLIALRFRWQVKTSKVPGRPQGFVVRRGRQAEASLLLRFARSPEVRLPAGFPGRLPSCRLGPAPAEARAATLSGPGSFACLDMPKPPPKNLLNAADSLCLGRPQLRVFPSRAAKRPCKALRSPPLPRTAVGRNCRCPEISQEIPTRKA